MKPKQPSASDTANPPRPQAVEGTRGFVELTRRRPSIVDHILNGPSWPDDIVDAINDRPPDPGRQIPL